MKATLLKNPHRYVTAGDSEFPAVSTVLRQAGLKPDYAGIPDHIMKNAAERGTMVHAACQYLLEGELDWASIEGGELEPFVRAFEQFQRDTSFRMLTSEMSVACPELGVAGTPDATGWLKRRAVVDIKATAKLDPSLGVQTGLYKAILDRTGYPVEDRFLLHLKKDGKYKLVACDDPLDVHAGIAAAMLYAGRGGDAALEIIRRWKQRYA